MVFKYVLKSRSRELRFYHVVSFTTGKNNMNFKSVEAELYLMEDVKFKKYSKVSKIAY